MALTNSEFLALAREALPDLHIPEDLVCEPFGDGPELADELLGLILEGKKTATCGCVWEYEAANTPLPQPGELWLTGNGKNEPTCLLQIETVSLCRFDEITPEFAYLEGEGDRTYESWRAGHERYFSRTLPPIGRAFSFSIPVVATTFRLIYRLS